MYQETKELPATETKHPYLTEWRKRNTEARKRGWYTSEEQADAACWLTCGIGEARSQGFFKPIIEPEWLRIGYEFSEAVNAADFDRCDEIVKLIEEYPTNANA